MVRVPPAAMTEQAATDLEAKINRHTRFRVSRRIGVPGRGVHLEVTDLQTGYKHRLHSAEHWRQIFNEMVLLVEGAWEEVTLAAIAQLEEAERACAGATPEEVSRRVVLRRQRTVLLRAYEAAQGVATREAERAGRRAIVIGRECVYPGDPRQGSAWRGHVWVAGKKVEAGAKTKEECLRLLATRRDAAVAALGVLPRGEGTVYAIGPRSDGSYYNLGLFRGFIGHQGRRHYVAARTYEECLRRLEELKAALGIGHSATA